MAADTIFDKLRQIAGRDTPKEHVTVDAKQIRDRLEGVEWGKMTPLQLDYMERVLSAGLAFIVEQQERKRYHVRAWNPSAKSPGVEKFPYGWEFDADAREWMDHLSRLVDKEHKDEVTYRSEPYQIDNAGIRHLASLVEKGWRVTILGWMSPHFPGRTCAVLVRNFPIRHPGEVIESSFPQ